MQLRCKLSIPDAAPDRYRRAVRVDVQQRRHAGEGDLVTDRVGDRVERVSAAKSPYPLTARDDPLYLVDRHRVVQLRRAKGDISRPIRAPIGHGGPLGVALLVAGQEYVYALQTTWQL